MDEIAAAIRLNKGAVISSSATLRAISAAVLPYHQDWDYCTAAADLQKHGQRS